MKIVIDIPEELLNKCIFGGAPTMSPVDKARCIIKIAHGKRLPEGHRRLIDADALFDKFEEVDWFNNADRDEVAEKILLDAPTIIEADKGCEI